MKVNLQDPSQLMSHLLLANSNVVEAVIATPQWKSGEGITITAQFNGIEVSAESAEVALQHLFKQQDEYYKQKYAHVEKEVQKRLEQRIKDEAEKIVDKMRDLIQVLESAGDLIKPYWDR